MPSFLQHFFPDVYKKIQEHGVDSNYRKYDNQTLQLFTSSLYLAALVATMFASSVTRKLVPLFLLEIAPTRIRGAPNILFRLNITIGILIANIVNYFTDTSGYGWRISLALAGFQAPMLTLGSLAVHDTPNSLIERGLEDEGKIVLEEDSWCGKC
ncbi:hypothetical protein ACSQ67_013933 [Phaseolus vulgaris]